MNVTTVQPFSNISSMSTTTNTANVADKLADIALASSVVEALDKDSKANEILKMLLIDLLFGTSDVSPLSPSQQAEMLHELISSGQPGSIAQAMGTSSQSNSYSSTGTPVASVPTGGIVSVSV